MYPQLKDIRALEGQTLKAIIQIPEFAKLGNIQAAATIAAKDFNEVKGPIDVHLGFLLDIRLRGDRRQTFVPRRVDIGARIDVDGSDIANASYSLVICKGDSPASGPILRKVHFDFEPIAKRNNEEPKPSVHMQVCGKFSRHHLSAGYTDQRLSALYPAFEKPRIPCQPMCVALMLNWLLLEFQSGVAAQPILKNDRWRKLICEAERKVLGPYFQEGAEYLTQQRYAGKSFLESHLYGVLG